MGDITTEEHAGALFLGFMVGSILYGVAVLQAYQYFMNYTGDSRRRKVMVVAVLILDSLHLLFSAVMMYQAISSPIGFDAPNLLWTLKAFATVKLFLIMLVQCYYLSIIRSFSSSAKGLMLGNFLSTIIQMFSVLLFVYVLGIGTTFMVYLERNDRFFDFTEQFQHAIFIGYGSTALIDSSIAVTLSFLLLRMHPGGRSRARNVVRFLVLFFVGTGLLTAIMAITTITVYALRPSTVLYLSIEFAVPSLYANSIFAMFNSKTRLQKRMETTTELKMSSLLLFDQPVGSPRASDEVQRET